MLNEAVERVCAFLALLLRREKVSSVACEPAPPSKDEGEPKRWVAQDDLHQLIGRYEIIPTMSRKTTQEIREVEDKWTQHSRTSSADARP